MKFPLQQQTVKDYTSEAVVSWEGMKYWKAMNTQLMDLFHTLMQSMLPLGARYGKESG